MYNNFEEMDNSARIWIYQSSEALPFEKIEPLSARLMNFLDDWQAHGNNLKASFTLKYSRFIIVALDEKSYQATGCSIDKLTHLIQALEGEFEISLLDRMQIAFKEEGMVNTLPMTAFRNELESGELSADTIVFNNLIETKAQLDKEWEVAVKDSWHKQMLPVA
jgi:hypothetical protein